MELKANMPLARPPMPPATTAPVFCKDCAHFNDKVAKSPPLCMAPLAQTINLVYGPQPNGCSDARRDSINSICGQSGKLFVPASTMESDSAVAGAREPYAKKPATDSSPCTGTPLKPASQVLIADRTFPGSTEIYMTVATDLTEFWLAIGNYPPGGKPLGFLRYESIGRGEKILGQIIPTFELREVMLGDSPAPHPIISLSGVLWTRPAALEADASIQSYLRQEDPNPQSGPRSNA